MKNRERDKNVPNARSAVKIMVAACVLLQNPICQQIPIRYLMFAVRPAKAIARLIHMPISEIQASSIETGILVVVGFDK